MQVIDKNKKYYITLTGIIVLTINLFFWKYYPWVIGLINQIDPELIQINAIDHSEILPLGISFFTLQGLAYIVDYNRGHSPYINFKDVFLGKIFFPQLIAGPIVRMQNLAPQLQNLPSLKLGVFSEGLILFSLGFFKKVAIADRMAFLIDPVFSDPAGYTSRAIILAIIGFTIQIWADFSGYTDMGRGVAKMLGINLPENFFSPYLAKSPSEFWRRWHVTLSEWIRDYIYIPLGGSRGSLLKVITIVSLTMAISGLWHGASGTFILWGLYHAGLLAMERIATKTNIPVFGRGYSVIFMLLLISFGWLIFRASSLDNLLLIVGIVFGKINSGSGVISSLAISYGFLLAALIQLIEYKSLESNNNLYRNVILKVTNNISINTISLLLGAFVSLVLSAALFLRISDVSGNFIYFKF